jgi:molybdenum cofactor synthesis domain-containing protein
MSDRPITAAILTISDRCSRGEAEDASGPLLETLVRQHLAAEVISRACVPDEEGQIASRLRTWAMAAAPPDLILTTGGTGLTPRDVTPEATATVLQKRSPGLLELARQRCYPTTPRAALSRGEAGVVERTLVINLPGSPKGAGEFLQALIDILPHAIRMTRGHDTDHSKSRQETP